MRWRRGRVRRSRLRDFGGVAAAAVWRKRRDSCADVFPYSVAKPECGMLVIGTGTAHGRLRKALFYVDKIEVGGQSNRFPPSHPSCGTLEPSSTVSTSIFLCLSSLWCDRNLALPAAVFSSCITIFSSFYDGTPRSCHFMSSSHITFAFTTTADLIDWRRSASPFYLSRS